jgi:uncharacterized protein YegP (UPF0339 family)
VFGGGQSPENVGSLRTGEENMAGLFEINKGTNGQFSFVLKAANNEVILRSEQYESKASAQKGIASVQANCALDQRYEKKDSSDNRPFFNLKAANNEIIGTSQMYSSVQARDAGIASVKANGASTTIKDNA